MISGEPGIGKSRLLLEFRRALGDDVIWREAHCVSNGQTTPYLPVIDLVKNGFGITETDDEGTMIAKVDARHRALDTRGAEDGAVPEVPAAGRSRRRDGRAR